jgi:hypothetical protein
MSDVIPFDPEAGVSSRSKPASRLSRLISFAHPQAHCFMQECREGAYPPEYAERVKEAMDILLSVSADMRAFERGGPRPASHFINRVMARITVDG